MVVTGQATSDQKHVVLDTFRAGIKRLLISTVVIEVGIDVPDATLMVVEHAERFGLLQLHQLRGRVGRSDKQSACVLVTMAQQALERLEVLTVRFRLLACCLLRRDCRVLCCCLSLQGHRAHLQSRAELHTGAHAPYVVLLNNSGCEGTLGCMLGHRMWCDATPARCTDAQHLLCSRPTTATRSR